jgi:hypothetical protein
MIEGVNSCMIYLICCNNLCKCHSGPPTIMTIKGKMEEGVVEVRECDGMD